MGADCADAESHAMFRRAELPARAGSPAPSPERVGASRLSRESARGRHISLFYLHLFRLSTFLGCERERK